VVSCATIYFCNKQIVDTAKGKLFSDTNSIPYNKIGLLLGTSQYLANGVLNPYYSYRIDATLKLMQTSKIKYVIISGDNGHKEYNEPEMMRADLIKAGIDSLHIFLDYAGFRTFDSMVRLKEIFGQDAVTVISQQFHNERAIYTASKLGINAVGFNATDVSTAQGLKTQMREKLARVKVFLDFLFGNKPKFLGDKIIIPA
jgi:SanA protein